MIGSVRWVTGLSCRCAPNEPSTILQNGSRIANHFGTRFKKAEYLQDPSQNPLNLEGSIGCPGQHKWCLTATVSWRRGSEFMRLYYLAWSVTPPRS